jgi:hypothetical protein
LIKEGQMNNKCRYLALVLAMLTGLGAFAQNVQSSGTIRELSGTVELKLAGAQNYVPAKAGDGVRQDTIISTGFKSTALVEVGSALITVRPLTRLTLTEIQASSGAETINVSLQTGRVRVDLNPPAGTRASMSVSSLNATASVRGTGFEFDTRNLRVYDGTVGFQGNRGQLMLVSAGSNSSVGTDGRAADPIVIRTEGLIPSAPVGVDPVSGAPSGSGGVAFSPTTIGVEIEYNNNTQ